MLRLRTLGAVDLEDQDGRSAVALLGQPKRLALLMYLAAAPPPGFVRRDVLVALFWPELDHGHARAALRQSMHVLREALGAGVIVRRRAEEIGVAADRLWCDVPAFERLHAAGEAAQALELYGGPFLAGFYIPGAPEFEQWVDRTRARIAGAAAAAARSLACRYEREQPELAVHWALRAAALAPDSELALRQLMSALRRAGDLVAAGRAYAEFTRRSMRELGVQPSPETQQAAQMLLHAPLPGDTGHRAPPGSERRVAGVERRATVPRRAGDGRAVQRVGPPSPATPGTA